VETRFARLAVETRFARFAVETRPKAPRLGILERYPTVPKPITVDVSALLRVGVLIKFAV
jgi:hypothetical protein